MHRTAWSSVPYIPIYIHIPHTNLLPTEWIHVTHRKLRTVLQLDNELYAVKFHDDPKDLTVGANNKTNLPVHVYFSHMEKSLTLLAV